MQVCPSVYLHTQAHALWTGKNKPWLSPLLYLYIGILLLFDKCKHIAVNMSLSTDIQKAS